MSTAFVASVVGCVAIGAWLAVQGHPWFALLAMLVGSSVKVKDDSPQNHISVDELIKIISEQKNRTSLMKTLD